MVEVLQKNGIPLCFEARAKGTAPSELLDAIGLGGTTRVLTAGLLPRANVPAVFGAINKALSYHKRGAGIAVTLPLTGVQNSILQLTAPADCARPTAEKEEHTMKGPSLRPAVGFRQGGPRRRSCGRCPQSRPAAAQC